MSDIQARLAANHDRGGHQLWQLSRDDQMVGHVLWGEETTRYEFVPLVASHFTADQLARVAGFVRECDFNEQHNDDKEEAVDA